MRTARSAATFSLALAASAGCVTEPACEGVRVEAVSAPERRLIGPASDYPADPSLGARWVELAASQRARRRAAWDAVTRVLAPVRLSTATPLGETTVPRFRTFHDRDDVNRVFQHLYGALTPEARAARARFAEGAVDDAFVFDTTFVDTLGTWSPERWEAYVASFTSAEAVASAGGLRRIGTSPSLTRHVVESYPEILRCLEQGAPAAEVPVGPRTDRLLRALVSLDGCDERRFGPFTVPRGDTLRASVSSSVGRARLAFDSAFDPDAGEPSCAASDACEVRGPGTFTVRVAGEGALDAVLEVDLDTVAAPVGCLDGPLPLDAVSVAAEWRRLDVDRPLPTFDTSAPRLADLRAAETPTWGEGQGQAWPGPDAIYTQRLPGGEVFVLAGLHVRTRELPLGLDVTLWWSDEPDEDFGADRPASVVALGGPWSHYKMCVAVEHTELDADPGGGFSGDAPSLARALASVHEGHGGPTWCSNPYIDGAPGLARGNCVGCHQHAMSGVRPGEVATEEARFPSGGRLAQRNNYPSDGFWGLDAGDTLASVIAEVVAYWR